MNWQTLAATSHYKTAAAIKQRLDAGDLGEARHGIEELIAALSRSEKRALKSHLIRLMMHIIKWHTQPDRRSLSWAATIHNTRDEIAEIQEETPSLNDAVVRALWDKAFLAAKRDAEAEMGVRSGVERLEWEDVFLREYELEGKMWSVS
jgi:hypothetical protein